MFDINHDIMHINSCAYHIAFILCNEIFRNDSTYVEIQDGVQKATISQKSASKMILYKSEHSFVLKH